MKDLIVGKKKSACTFRVNSRPLHYKEFSSFRDLYKFESKLCYKKIVIYSKKSLLNDTQFWKFIKKHNFIRIILKPVSIDGVLSKNETH